MGKWSATGCGPRVRFSQKRLRQEDVPRCRSGEKSTKLYIGAAGLSNATLATNIWIS